MTSAPNGCGSRSPTSATRPDRPFGVGFITQLIEYNTTNIEIALEERVPVFIFSFADPDPWVGRAKDAGAVTICQVQSLELARVAVDAGADVLLAQGNEAGGHTGETNLLPLLVDLVERYPHLPVLAAGGITSGRALAGALATGAEGASLGTAFLATPEAVEVPDTFKERIVLSDGQDTTFTRLYDLLGTRPWPDRIAGRVYRNRLVREWDGQRHRNPCPPRGTGLRRSRRPRQPRHGGYPPSTWARAPATSTPSGQRRTCCATSARPPKKSCKPCRTEFQLRTDRTSWQTASHGGAQPRTLSMPLLSGQDANHHRRLNPTFRT